MQAGFARGRGAQTEQEGAAKATDRHTALDGGAAVQNGHNGRPAMEAPRSGGHGERITGTFPHLPFPLLVSSHTWRQEQTGALVTARVSCTMWVPITIDVDSLPLVFTRYVGVAKLWP